MNEKPTTCRSRRPTVSSKRDEETSAHAGDGEEEYNSILGYECSENDEHTKLEWMERIDGYATIDGNQVAKCGAKLIRRDDIRSSFYAHMEESSDDTTDLVLHLFDDSGNLKQVLIEHTVRKGTGVWDDELSNGDILLIETIQVDREWRRQGVARRIIDAVLRLIRVKSETFYVFLYPGLL